MLGVDADHTSRSSRLTSNDVVVLYTDGLSDARTSTGFVGVAGIAETLLRHVGEPAESIVAALAALSRNAIPTDDVAVLVLKAL